MTDTALTMRDAQALRTSFLQASGYSFFLTSPSTSRHLISERSQLVHSAGANPDSCTACGSLFLSGWTMSLRLTPTNRKSNDKAKMPKKPTQEKKRHLRCGFCHRVTKHVVTNPSKTKRQKVVQNEKASMPQPSSDPALEPVIEKSTKPLSSKQRAKARRDREGLQSLLNHSTQSRSAPTLNLMDLLKK